VSAIHFILAEDRAQSRYLKRILAEKGSWLHVVVGTWVELGELLRGVFLLGSQDDLWEEKLADAAGRIPGAFWAASLDVAPVDTLACLDRELRRLLMSTGPGSGIRDIQPEGLDARGARHLAGLTSLHEAMGETLPAELDLIHRLLAAHPAEASKKVVVYPGMLHADVEPWRRALLQRMEEIFEPGADMGIQLLISSIRQAEKGGAGTGIDHLASQLFSERSDRVPLDDSIQWLAVRDPLQEVEVIAGMIQQALRDDKSLRYADFALLVPDDGGYALHLQAIFSRAGIPLSGLDTSSAERDLGAEVLFYFLLSLRKPAPVMALAAFLTSPLLPWREAEGQNLAQRVMDGHFDFPAPDGSGAKARQLLTLLREGVETADELSKALKLLLGSLQTPDERCESHHRRAGELIESLLVLLGGGEIAWKELLAACIPITHRSGEGLQLSREGVAVFSEQEEPWRKVRQLWVLGFTDGRYPATPGTSPVFGEADLHALREQGGLAVDLGEDILARRRDRFKRQLASAAEKAHFLIPRRSKLGEPLHPSESLTFMAQLFAGVEEAKDLVRELERSADRRQCQGLALAPEQAPNATRELKIADLALRRNLLQELKRADGSIHPLSPSSLATLMVSPLAWLLGRMGLEPREWAPEQLDVATKGTLAHRVFENLFSPGRELPAEQVIADHVPGLLQRAIRDIAPFLMAAEWRVERAHLQKEIEQAATRWSLFLQNTGGQVLGNEVWLNGMLDDMPIHGSADSVVGLPGGRIFVVDFKKSKSGKRREQMEKGYDSQTSLYRLMLQTGDAMDKDDELGRALRRGDEIGVLYYLMNDQVALSDTAGWLPGDVPGAFELGAGISTEAMALIRQRISQVRNGHISLNTEGDEKWFDRNAGIRIYALDNSPLLRMFMHPGDTTPEACPD
jgi:ATP-dependent helicase/nuclease subunit B